jgi:hypothetical protein
LDWERRGSKETVERFLHVCCIEIGLKDGDKLKIEERTREIKSKGLRKQESIMQE